MTNYVSGYNFMDLLKDKGIVPLADVNTNHIISKLFVLLDRFSAHVELPVEHHDFMDLMHDKGFVPEPSNDNDLSVQVA